MKITVQKRKMAAFGTCRPDPSIDRSGRSVFFALDRSSRKSAVKLVRGDVVYTVIHGRSWVFSMGFFHGFFSMGFFPWGLHGSLLTGRVGSG